MNEMDLELLRLAGKGYCCSQVLILLALRLQGLANAGLVRAAAGLCHGVSQGCETCGVLTGAACLLGYYAGKGTDDETENHRLQLMLADLDDWFRSAVGGCGIRCEDIVGTGGRPDPARCGGLVAAAFAKVLELLQAEGIDPSQPRDPA